MVDSEPITDAEWAEHVQNKHEWPGYGSDKRSLRE